MRVFKYSLALLFAFVSLSLAIGVKAEALSPIDLSTSPLPISLTAKPGTSITTDIRIKNNSDTQEVKAGLMKFGAYGEEGKPALKDREKGDDYFDWVSFSPNKFVAEKNQWKTIKMTINIPKDAAFGYYYAATFTPTNGKPTGKGNVLIGSTAVLVLLDVQNPNAKRSLQIISFESKKRVYEFLPATFSVRFHNNGNIHVRPHGNIYIKKGNRQLASLILNNQEGSILPGTNRIFSVDWGDGFPAYVDKQKGGRSVIDKQGHTEKQLKWDWSNVGKIKFGRYTAHLTVIYDNGHEDVPLDASVNFWVIPWRIIFGILLVLGLVGLGLWSSAIKPFVRKFKKGN